MKSEPIKDDVAKVAPLLEESTDYATFETALKTLDANPALMESLMTVQFVKDAMQGNPCPDMHYTARIMQYIADAERKRIEDEKSDK